MESERVRLLMATDDPPLRQRLAGLLEMWAEAKCVDISLAEWTGVPEESCRGILFLDEEHEAAQDMDPIRARQDLWVILVSRDKNAVMQMYEHHSAGFLSNPVTGAALERAMDRCFSAWRPGMRWLEAPYRRDIVRLPLCLLRCAEADGRETVLHCASGRLRCSVPLGRLTEQLPQPPFFPCQRSFIVHLDAVEQLVGGDVVLAGERQLISVSRKQRIPLQDALEQRRRFER